MRAAYNVSNNRLGLLVALLVVSLVGGGYVFWHKDRPSQNQYATAPVTRGTITQAVIATGTVNPVTTVQVGAYVSGTIQSLGCDYNTKVTAGQLCAKIDPRPYQVLYDQASANLEAAIAQVKKDQAQIANLRLVYERDAKLVKGGSVSQQTMDSDKSALDQALAQSDVDAAAVKQKQAALDAAKVNLDYTDIISPVDGTVVSRSIDVGQTVASSFQTPTLFLIAKDLTQMQVDTSINESDIGGVKVGQKALFSVEAYPGQTFEGQIVQVRQAPIAVQNVVTYDAVIGVANDELKLLPGMTANVRLVMDEHKDVLKVPAQALHFMPPAEKAAGKKTPDAPRVYVVRDGDLQAVAVTTGLSDGRDVEVTADGLTDADKVVTGLLKSASDKGGVPPPRSPLRF